MILFTWNLHRNHRALRLALKYLAGVAGDVVAVLQELPVIADSTSKARKLASSLTKSRMRCLGVTGSDQSPGRVGFFTSSGISATGPITSDGNRRMGMAVLKSKTWSELRVVGIHAVDRRNVATDFARGAWALLSRQEIENFWRPKLPLIVMGDLNADPYHPEVSARLGLFAVRDRKEMKREWQSSAVAGLMRPLYNPMWSLLPEDSTRPAGTLVVNTEDQGIRWRICDQILVSNELVASLGPVEILSQLNATKLTTSHGNPVGKISDHLPVQVSVT